MKRYIHRTVMQIKHPQEKKQTMIRSLFVEAHQAREKGLKKIRDDGLKGKDYSDAVVALDSELQELVTNKLNTIHNMVV